MIFCLVWINESEQGSLPRFKTEASTGGGMRVSKWWKGTIQYYYGHEVIYDIIEKVK